jgi:hypothetical protein
MTMAGAVDLAKMVPGFEFLQTLMKGASSALPGMPGVGSIPGMSQWIAPTLDPEELEKRIQELKTVQFWLEQNARLLSTTIQALEVQRMTLSTLQTMNLPLADLRDALKINLPAAAPKVEPSPKAASAPEPAPEPEPEPEAEIEPPKAAKAAKPAPPAVDPLQWWGALTQQFTELATQAVKDSAADAAKTLAGGVMKQAVKHAVKKTASAAGKTLKQATGAAAGAAAKASKASKTSKASPGAPARKRGA